MAPLRRTDVDTPFRRPVLTVYEFLINIDLEVITAWKHKKTVTTVLLLSIRWAMFSNEVLRVGAVELGTCGAEVDSSPVWTPSLVGASFVVKGTEVSRSSVPPPGGSWVVAVSV